MASSDPEPPEVIDFQSKMLFRDVPSLRPRDERLWEWFNWFNEFGSNCTKFQHSHCWGSSILRVSYQDDAQFALAVSAIRRLSLVIIENNYEEHHKDEDIPDELPATDDRMHPVHRERLEQWHRDMLARVKDSAAPGARITKDRLMTDEVLRWYHDIVVEDQTALDGADVYSALRYYFQNSECKDQVDGARAAVFVYLDQESIEMLAGAPSDEELTRMAVDERAKVAWQHWVKVISTGSEYSDDEEEIRERMVQNTQTRRRMRLYDMRDVLFGWVSMDLTEMGVEGSKRVGFPGPYSSEWQFCEFIDATSRHEEWLKELYGEQPSLSHLQ